MAKRLTPIERAIEGEPPDRRRRYESRLEARGIKRISLAVRAEHALFFHKLAALSRVSDAAGWASVMSEPLEFFSDVPDELVGKR